MQSYVLILIHGTILSPLMRSAVGGHQPGVEAPWTAEGSKFRLGIGSLLGGNVHFEVLNWAGGNNHHDREAGVEKLAACIGRLKRVFPSGKYYVIGHSHGGSIGWAALSSDDEVFRGISGLVCMGTPFICYRSPAITLAKETYVRGPFVTLIVLCALLVSGVYFLLHGILSHRYSWFALQQIAVAGLLVLILIVAFTCAGPVGRSLHGLHAKAKELCAASTKQELSGKTLLIRSVGDETAFLPAFYVASWFLSRTSERLERLWSELPTQKVNSNEPGILVMTLVISLAIAGIFGLSADPAAKFVIASFGIAIFYTQGWFPQFKGALRMLLSSLFIAFTLAFRCIAARVIIGPELMWCAFFLDVIVEPVPPGTWNVVQLGSDDARPTSDLEVAKWRLAHSIYEDFRVPGVIAAWILSGSTAQD